jgi:hypothetical protein
VNKLEFSNSMSGDPASRLLVPYGGLVVAQQKSCCGSGWATRRSTIGDGGLKVLSGKRIGGEKAAEELLGITTHDI